MDQAESRWMLAVNGQVAIPPVQHTGLGVQQPITTVLPISQPRSSDSILPTSSLYF